MAIKNFRVNRIAEAAVNAARPGTQDYEIPAGFRLSEHAGSKQAWELGDGDAVEAVVELRRDAGPAAAAARLGVPVEGDARAAASASAGTTPSRAGSSPSPATSSRSSPPWS